MISEAQRAYGVEWRKRRLAQGLCLMCSGPSRKKPDGTHLHHCQPCADKRLERQRVMYVPRRNLSKVVEVERKPGPTWCLRCSQTFQSSDVVNIRICDGCRAEHEATIERGLDADGWAIDIDGRG